MPSGEFPQRTFTPYSNFPLFEIHGIALSLCLSLTKQGKNIHAIKWFVRWKISQNISTTNKNECADLSMPPSPMRRESYAWTLLENVKTSPRISKKFAATSISKPSSLISTQPSIETTGITTPLPRGNSSQNTGKRISSHLNIPLMEKEHRCRRKTESSEIFAST